uniref:Uncharacterized protein n=1 Tax=Amphora coffeiformis TaxID=265554 RepID=A0A7S3P5B8_9STRA
MSSKRRPSTTETVTTTTNTTATLVCNPFRDDSTIVALLKELDTITTRRQFRRWRKSFLEAFEVFLEQDGCVKVRTQYRKLCEILSRHVEQVKRLHAHIQVGDLSPKGCTVKSRQTLGNFFDQMIRVKQILIELLPTTARMEKEIGYTKFHLAAVLIDNGFVAYDRLSLCDEIHFHFKNWCLQDVANKLFLLEMDHYHNHLNIFCDILADLGLNHAMEVCRKFLHLDDEETILWEGDHSSLEDDDDDLLSDSETEDLDPLPDLSDITFDDEASLNLPLWKVNEFYYDNAEMAEKFRTEMKRKSFAMFGGSNKEKSQKPPNMPTRSTERDASPPPRNDNEGCPSKPQRRLSIEPSSPTNNEDSPERDHAEPKTKTISCKVQRSLSLSSAVVSVDLISFKESSREIKPQRHVSMESSKSITASDNKKGSKKSNSDKKPRSKNEEKPSRKDDKLSGSKHDIKASGSMHGKKSDSRQGRKSDSKRDAKPDSKTDKKSGSKRDKTPSASKTSPSNQEVKPNMDTTKRMSNCTMETELLSDVEGSSSDGESFQGDEEDALVEPASEVQLLNNTRIEGLRRVGSGKFILPPTNYLAVPRGKICEIRPFPGENDDIDSSNEATARSQEEDKPEKSFYSFANYYHGNPSDWKLSKTTH